MSDTINRKFTFPSTQRKDMLVRNQEWQPVVISPSTFVYAAQQYFLGLKRAVENLKIKEVTDTFTMLKREKFDTFVSEHTRCLGHIFRSELFIDEEGNMKGIHPEADERHVLLKYAFIIPKDSSYNVKDEINEPQDVEDISSMEELYEGSGTWEFYKEVGTHTVKVSMHLHKFIPEDKTIYEKAVAAWEEDYPDDGYKVEDFEEQEMTCFRVVFEAPHHLFN